MTEKISRFLDDDLSHDETLHLLKTITEQPDLKDKLKRYAAVSHAIKTDDFLWISIDFAMRIQQEIQQTPIDGLPHQPSDGYLLQ
jgi:sigma-E factor negative regulatory protein RseA